MKCNLCAGSVFEKLEKIHETSIRSKKYKIVTEGEHAQIEEQRTHLSECTSSQRVRKNNRSGLSNFQKDINFGIEYNSWYCQNS